MLRFQHRAEGWYLAGFIGEKANKHFKYQLGKLKSWSLYFKVALAIIYLFTGNSLIED